MIEFLEADGKYGMPHGSLHIARMLLIEACIPPRPDTNEPDDQYEITSFKMDSTRIEITNHGQVHVLKVREHK